MHVFLGLELVLVKPALFLGHVAVVVPVVVALLVLDLPEPVFIATTKIHIHSVFAVSTPLDIHGVSSLSPAARLPLGGPFVWAVHNPRLADAELDGAGLLDSLLGPVVVAVEFDSLADPHGLQEFPQVVVVGAFLELEFAGVSDKSPEFLWKSLGEIFGGDGYLAFHDHFVLLLRIPRFEGVPREGSPQQVHQHVPDRLDVVSAGLLDSQVRVNRNVADRAEEFLAVPVGDVLA